MNRAHELVLGMREHLLRAKVSAKRLAALLSHFYLWPDPVMAEYRIIVEDIHLHEYREVVEIWQLLPEERWAAYVAMEIEDLREQQLLNSALRNLRTAFNQRVLDHGKTKKTRSKADKATAGVGGGGSGEAGTDEDPGGHG